MSDLPWNKFLELAGDPRKNWEVLCREVIRRHYERHGPLLTRKQQPGVEFHLVVAYGGGILGEPGRHWGWQCRWYGPSDFWADESRLRSAQRESIEAAIVKSAEQVKDLSDWVLWTREKLSADDERWFDGLAAPFELHRWDEETLVGLLSGEAEILRQTWFGEMVLDDARLSAAREETLAPIEQRYVEALHVRTPSEEMIRAFLPNLRLDPTLGVLERILVHARSSAGTQRTDELTRGFLHPLKSAAAALQSLRDAAESRELPGQELTTEAAGRIDPEAKREILLGGSTVVVLGRIKSWLAGLGEQLGTPVIVAMGGGGAGKTHLAAALSGPDGAAKGVLVLGRQFGEEFDGDDLARASGLAPTLDQLLEAMEALGAREGRRVPLVIDGLNESDDPRRWHDLLARLRVRAARLRHVVIVATIRPSYRDFAIPDNLPSVDLIGLTSVEGISIERYFSYYKIDATPEAIHWWRPSDPLLLGIFCKTVNPERREVVSAGDLPKSLHEVFDDYLEDVCARVGRALKVEGRVVSDALDELALSFFDQGTRELPRARAAEILGDGHWASWEDSLRFHLEGEGILVRDVRNGREEVSWSYDMLAGHAIARGILGRHLDPADLASGEALAMIEAHPLCEDIVTGLSGSLAPAGIELTEILEANSRLQAEAALAATRLAPEEVGPGAVAAIERIFAERPVDVLDALAATTLTTRHPLNGVLLDQLLGDLAVWERDLSWTEWVRGRSELVIEQVREVAKIWRRGEKSGADEAATVWLSWLLTTTDKPLYDEAIHALYRFGRRNPERLFDRALRMLGANDRAVAAGLMAAAYGVVLASQDPGSPTREAVIVFAGELRKRLLEEGATQPTSHWLIREYAYRTAQLAAWLSNGEFAAPTEAAQPPLPKPAGEVAAFKRGDTGWEAVAGAFQMDFSNYTIGRMVEGRANYQEDHPQFLQITGEIRARVAHLGWNKERFDEIDRVIGEHSVNRGNDPGKTERYGKKYGWAGFYEAAGRLSDRGELRLDSYTHEGWRLSDVPIDPSFPDTARIQLPELTEWVPQDGEDEVWMRGGEIEIPDRLLHSKKGGRPWVVVDGYLRREPTNSKRQAFCFIRGLLAREGWSSVKTYVAEHGVKPELVPNNPSDFYCFAGEAPWAPTFDSFATATDGGYAVRMMKLGRHDDGPEIELLAVDFNWEHYHSLLNQAIIGSLPSKAFARFAGLRKLPDQAEFVDGEGLLAARSLAVVGEGWSGHLLYARADLVEAYCAERGGGWGWVIWGERVLTPLTYSTEPPPDWLIQARQRGEDRFSRIVSLSELSQSR